MTTDAALYRLLTWLSPGYPLGAFAYSHGLEQAVEAGLVRDADGAKRYVATVLRAGSGRSDAALFAAAYRAASDDDAAELRALAELAAAWRATSETALEAGAQGRAFLSVTRRAWPHPLLDAAAESPSPPSLPVVVAIAAAAHGVPLAQALLAYLHSLAANLVSAGVRLVPLGQTDAQRILAALEPDIAAARDSGLTIPLDAVGASAAIVERCSVLHETQYTRLFRS
ncbi:MAG TPA: urease accessory UreF family protein [Stellaceae bacterium]|nr:urease accessory UreF family protein [Stellaceae bacterium]